MKCLISYHGIVCECILSKNHRTKFHRCTCGRIWKKRHYTIKKKVNKRK